jgi:hypothetical protein
VMTRNERVRRTTLLCQHFARNLAYYRCAWKGGKLFGTGSQFWRTVNGNCLDICVLEWCKLFGDKNERQYWRKIVPDDPDKFEAAMLSSLKIEKAEFQKQIKQVREYRDTFVAHLDSSLTMIPPNFDIPKAAVWFYHGYLADREPYANLGAWAELEDYYKHCESEAKTVYSQYRL